MADAYRFFSHTACEFFPCHAAADPDDFNCLFCYCPLYLLPDCGGNFSLTSEGVKDCTACTIPHHRDHYDDILLRLSEALRPFDSLPEA